MSSLIILVWFEALGSVGCLVSIVMTGTHQQITAHIFHLHPVSNNTVSNRAVARQTYGISVLAWEGMGGENWYPDEDRQGSWKTGIREDKSLESDWITRRAWERSCYSQWHILLQGLECIAMHVNANLSLLKCYKVVSGLTNASAPCYRSIVCQFVINRGNILM